MANRGPQLMPKRACGIGRAAWGQVEEVKLVGDRLHFKRLTGSGPSEGWISTKISGKALWRGLRRGRDIVTIHYIVYRSLIII